MGRVKDYYIELHEKKISEYLDLHPNATEEEAYEKTSDAAYNDLGEYMAELADRAKDEAEDRMMERGEND